MEHDVFICHASENKDFVEPLAKALMEKGLRVWYAPFELKIGDSLRQEIDRGLANSRYGIVVLSEAFFTKNWPRSELDALASRQNAEGRKVILPIWHEIEANDVRDKSPLLHSLLAARSSDGMEFVVGQIFSVCSEPIESTQKSVFQTSGDIGLRERCLDVIRRGDRTEWVKLVDELQTPIERQLIAWKHDGETAIQKDSDTWREAVLKAVDICMPGFVPIFASVEAGQKELWNDATRILRRLALLENKILGGTQCVFGIGLDMLYVAGNIGMSIAVETGQNDFIWDWMLLPMPSLRLGEEIQWMKIREAFCRFNSADPFRFLLNLYSSEHITNFFQSEERMKEFLFKANILQSIIELRLLTLTEKGAGIVEKRDENYRSNINVLPLWCLIKPDDFRIWTLDLFGSKKGFITFFMMDSVGHIEDEIIWHWWKGWKKICESLTYQLTHGQPFLRTEWLMLPGETNG
jgi:hypothetical protein